MTFFLAKPPTTHALLTEILARLSQLETQGKKRDEQFDRIIALQRRLLGKIRPSAEELRLQLEAARYPLSEYLERRQREADQFMSHPSRLGNADR